MAPCSKSPLLVLTGPTALGKTELSLRLAERYGCPIVSADSRQIYREIPIGTAAPTADELQRVTHYFIGTRSVVEDYNAGQYERDCIPLLEQLQTAHRNDSTPFAILTGGSMMYLDAIVNGLDDIPAVSTELKQQIRETYRQKGLTWLQDEVQKLDPDYWHLADRQNPQRLLHCVEVCRATGQPYSSYRTGGSKQRPWLATQVVMLRAREELYQRINLRVEQMMESGLEEECKQVIDHRQHNSLQTVGYREMFAYMDGLYSREEAIRLIKQNSRHYAKRQMTWFRADKNNHYIDANLGYEEQIDHITAMLAEHSGMY